VMKKAVTILYNSLLIITSAPVGSKCTTTIVKNAGALPKLGEEERERLSVFLDKIRHHFTDDEYKDVAVKVILKLLREEE